ncbi:polysaccharide biosynthesis tyrosine autokinase [Mycetocola tolaasinivorans]|uniref:non-specific protein-tyrosine kinase n=1 Tax=Mycetocola tolaasinivorans TaxID=76635 RepID=A0A3L7ADK2_9MICO|nr:polysaccharide biosynthesis tyrosine autokinase [Mycetocola tolaasinivorans]RLP77798.1 polysaccharide biosynthesis tyrosine autokinase [Mycetocola tolaasinivorans]
MDAETNPDIVNDNDRSLRDFVRMIRTYWMGALLIIALSIASGAVWTLFQPQVFEAKATGIVQAPRGNDPSNAYSSEALSKSQAASYATVATSLAVAERVEKAGVVKQSAGVLLGRITALQPQDTVLIEITAKGPTGDSARTLADAWITAMSEQIEAIQGNDGVIGAQNTKFVSVSKAATPNSPVSPNVIIALVLATITGTLLAIAYAVIRQHLDRRIRSADVLEQRYGTSVLGTIPMNPFLRKGSQLLSQLTETSTESRHASFAMAESLRELRTNLSYVDVDNPPQVFVVTSPNPGEGKSTLSANLAETLAVNSGKNVVVIDCDLRRPTLSKIFNAVEGAGLTDVLSGRAELQQVIQPCGDSEKLWILGAGRIPPNPSELLGSRAMKELLAALGEQSIVILDAPPILPVTDAVVLANSADGVVLVASARNTTYEQFGRAQQLIKRGGAHLLGTVLNRVPTSGQDAHQYGYYGGTYYANEETPATTATAQPSDESTVVEGDSATPIAAATPLAAPEEATSRRTVRRSGH